MLKIRLQRTGRRNQPYFRVIVVDSKSGPKSGKYVEKLGFYDPKMGEVSFKEDRVKHWMSVGAQVSDTVHNFLVDKKIIEGKKLNVLPKKSPTKKKKAGDETEGKPQEEVSSEAPKEAEEKLEEEQKKEESEKPEEQKPEEKPVEEQKEEEAPEEKPQEK